MTTCRRCKAESETERAYQLEEWVVASEIGGLCPSCYKKLQTLRQQVRDFESAKMREFMEVE